MAQTHIQFATADDCRRATDLLAAAGELSGLRPNNEMVVARKQRGILYRSGIPFRTIPCGKTPDSGRELTDAEKLRGGRFYAHEW